VQQRAARWAPIAAIAALALVLVGCGDDGSGIAGADRYSREVRDEFVTSCTAQGDSEALCRCFYDSLAANVPFSRFQKLDQQIGDGSERVPADILDYAAACGADPTVAETTTTAP
jgi:hypothetical protein